MVLDGRRWVDHRNLEAVSEQSMAIVAMGGASKDGPRGILDTLAVLNRINVAAFHAVRG